MGSPACGRQRVIRSPTAKVLQAGTTTRVDAGTDVICRTEYQWREVESKWTARGLGRCELEVVQGDRAAGDETEGQRFGEAPGGRVWLQALGSGRDDAGEFVEGVTDERAAEEEEEAKLEGRVAVESR